MHIDDMTLERCLMVEVHIHCVCSSDKFGACFYISMLERRVSVLLISLSTHFPCVRLLHQRLTGECVG